MTPAEAKEIIDRQTPFAISPDVELGIALGYLEGRKDERESEAVRGLVEALAKIKNADCKCFSGCGPCFNELTEDAGIALSKFREDGK